MRKVLSDTSGNEEHWPLRDEEQITEMYDCPSILIWETFWVIMQGEETQTETGKRLKVK